MNIVIVGLGNNISIIFVDLGYAKFPYFWKKILEEFKINNVALEADYLRIFFLDGKKKACSWFL